MTKIVQKKDKIEFESGQTIVNKKNTKKFAEELSEINQSVGGNPIPNPSEASSHKSTSDAKNGGLLVGKSHAEGGMKAIVSDTGQEIEVEGGEAVLSKEASELHKEKISEINTYGGNGVPIKQEGGELQKGIETEQEHKQTLEELKKGDISVGQAIEKTAKDHLAEDPKYYSKLAAIESNIPEEAYEATKKVYLEMIAQVVEKEQNKLQSLLTQKENLWKEVYAWNEQEKTLPYGKEKNELSDKRRANYQIIKDVELNVIFQENVLKAVKNNGDISSFTDKKGLEHTGIPSFINIPTEQISFDEEVILVEPIPPYIPLINEDVFRSKGYVFDSIRIMPDEYLVAVNGYKEVVGQVTNYSTMKSEGGKTPEDFIQGYVLVTLDQLVLINDYYYTRAKAKLTKEAEDKNKRQEEYYDKLPVARREAFLNQKNFYQTLPAAIRKKISQQEYESLSLEEKEKIYKPYKRYGAKRLTSKLEDNEMWISFHKMYERFINPAAVEPKPRFANAEVWAYWSAFREMMKWKIKDIKIQREAESEARKIALETSFGESNTDSVLQDDLGILVKRQDGSKIQAYEIEQIKQGWLAIENTFGQLSFHAKEQNLKISHTGNKYVFASKAAGVYIPKMKTIAVSFKFGENQFNQIFAHEVAHWIDNTLGDLKGKRYLTDDFEGLAGRIAFTFRSKMNERSDSDYTNATKECFARAMEQYFAITNYGEEASLIYTSSQSFSEYRAYFSEKDYVSKSNFYESIKPMIEEFLQENKDFFKALIKTEMETKKMDDEVVTSSGVISDVKANLTPVSSQTENKPAGSELEIPSTETEKSKAEEIKPDVKPELVKEDYDSRVKHLDNWLKTDNKAVINISVNNLLEWVEKHPQLFPQYIKKMYDIPKKFRRCTNPYDKDWGSVSIVDWLATNKINIFELLDVKDYSLPKYIPFSTSSENKTFMGIHSEFVSMDELRLVFLGSNFNDFGVTTTNAHILLFTPYRGDSNEKNGNYCYTKKCFTNEEEVQKLNYVNWQAVIPKDQSYKQPIDVEHFWDYLKNTKEYGLTATEVVKTFGLKYPDSDDAIFFNLEFFIVAVKSMVSLGHKELEIGYSAPSRAATIYPIGMGHLVSSNKTDFALIMPVMANEDLLPPIYNLENNCVHFKGNEKEYCFDKIIRTEAKKGKSEKEIKEKSEKEIAEIKQSLEKEKTELKESLEKEKSAKKFQKLADRLEIIEGMVWDKLKINSGSSLYSSLDLQRRYKYEMDKALKGKFEMPIPNEVYDVLEDDNYHSLNSYLKLSGYYGEEAKTNLINYIKNKPTESKQNFFSLDVFGVAPIVEDTADVVEWKEAIDTLKMLLETKPNNKEWREAIETLEMLISTKADVKKLKEGGKVDYAKLLIISPKNPLSTQLNKEVGKTWNAIDFDDVSIGNFNLVTEKTTGKKFVVYPARIYSELNKEALQDDYDYLKNMLGLTINNLK